MTYKVITSKVIQLTTLSVLITTLLAGWLLPGRVSALDLTERSVAVSSAIPSATATHTFKFTFASTSNIGSIVFEYCDNSPLLAYSCNSPAGLNVSSATLSSQSGNIGFSIDGVNTTATKLVLTRASIPALIVPSSYIFDNITNPSAVNTTEFIRITTYTTADGSGAYTDHGSVAFSTINPFSVNTTVPPFLDICVGVTVAIDCSSTSGDFISLGNLSTSSVKTATSQFASGTNSITGYSVFVLGTTMTSGNNSIPALSTASTSSTGTSQFGLNLRTNTSPAVGQNPSGPGTATPYANYNILNRFLFIPGDAIAHASGPSNYNRMTASYIVNISNKQAAGVYSTTLTYLATATF